MVSLAIAAPSAATAAVNMLFILDGSNSMWGQVDGVAKIETAKKVFENLLSDLPPDTKVGLMAYGHRVKGDCTDVETLVAIGGETAGQIVQRVKSITPIGKTPMAHSIQASAASFAGFEEENNNVVLISDGIESCEGDPCGEAAALVSRGVQVKVHVVGFDVDAETRAQLECIAEKGRGQYFNADNAITLMEAMVEIQQVAQAAPEPEPVVQVAAAGEIFRDDFDGEDLADHWEVLNPNPDAFIVEDGELLVVGSSTPLLTDANAENIFRLTEPLPKGDWVATLKLSMDYQTGSEYPFLGMYDDEANHVMVSAFSNSYYEAIRGAQLHIGGVKRSKGKETSFYKVIWGGASGQAFAFDGPPNPILLRLTKKGRSYTPAVKLDGIADSEWIEHDRFTVLRQKGNLAFGIHQWRAVDNETTMVIDWFKIETLGE